MTDEEIVRYYIRTEQPATRAQEADAALSRLMAEIERLRGENDDLRLNAQMALDSDHESSSLFEQAKVHIIDTFTEHHGLEEPLDPGPCARAQAFVRDQLAPRMSDQRVAILAAAFLAWFEGLTAAERKEIQDVFGPLSRLSLTTPEGTQDDVLATGTLRFNRPPAPEGTPDD